MLETVDNQLAFKDSGPTVPITNMWTSHRNLSQHGLRKGPFEGLEGLEVFAPGKACHLGVKDHDAADAADGDNNATIRTEGWKMMEGWKHFMEMLV